MKKKYLDYVPKALQDDFIRNRVIPFVGAGFSENAELPQNVDMPDWDGLGKKVAEYLPEYTYTNAIDAFSLFESEFSRAKMIELLAKELKIHEIQAEIRIRHFVICILTLFAQQTLIFCLNRL